METYGIIRLIASLQAPTSNTYDTVRVKRRLYGSYAWTILGEWDASGFDDTINVIFEDAYALGRYKLYEYTIVPVCDGVERDSETILVESNFHGAIIADIDTLYVINLDPEITSVTRNVDTAVEKTLAGKYPIVSYGNEANYYTGSFSGTILKWDADTDTYDFEQSVEYREELIDWLTNTKPKVLKIQDGRGWLINVNGNVSISSDEHPDKVTVSFDFVEIGDLNDTDDLQAAGLVSLVS